MEALMTVTCHEPEGTVDRTVYELDLTRENLLKFWEHSRKFPTLFTKEINTDFNKFCNIFLYDKGNGLVGANGLFYVVDDFVGVYYLTDISAPYDAQAHYTFFDRRHRGRIELTKSIIKYIFETYKFHRLSTTVPTYAKEQTHAFVKRLGFKHEGVKARAAKFKGTMFDEYLYGITREEILGLPFNRSGFRHLVHEAIEYTLLSSKHTVPDLIQGIRNSTWSLDNGRKQD